MAEIKTKQNDLNVIDFLNSVPDEKKRQDSFAILELFQRATGLEPKMWGDSIVGFGSYHYKYASGHQGDAPLTGFSPRKQNFSLYVHYGFDQQAALLQKLGKFKTGKSCLYLNKLADIDLHILRELVEQSVEHMRKTHP
jgi:hypothetical protein